MVKFSTSLICCDLSDIKSDLDVIASLPEEFHYLHADFMDGHFVPRYGISPELVQWIKKRYGDLFTIDAHLMTDDPFTYADVIAPYCDEYAFHIEAVKDPFRVIQKIDSFEGHHVPYIAHNLFTDVIETKKTLHALDRPFNVLFMGISPGVLGTDSCPTKVLMNMEKFASGDLLLANIIIDGGVNFNSIGKYTYYHDDLKTLKLVCGNSTIFKQDEETRNMSRKDLIVHNASRIRGCIRSK